MKTFTSALLKLEVTSEFLSISLRYFKPIVYSLISVEKINIIFLSQYIV